MKSILTILSIALLITYNIQANSMDNSLAFPEEYEISTQLSQNDLRILKHMREEEKLARDVYDYFYIKYDLPIFSNISQAEQRHMDRVLAILTDNGIKDPASSKPGLFNNNELQVLYDKLISQGEKSVIDALKVGARIEDVDIKDLMDFSNETNNSIILNVFENLTCGSRNHMRAFISMLKSYDTTYTPQYISQELFNEIINENHEKCGRNNGNRRNKKNRKVSCSGMEKGNGSRMGRGQGRGRGGRI